MLSTFVKAIKNPTKALRALHSKACKLKRYINTKYFDSPRPLIYQAEYDSEVDDFNEETPLGDSEEKSRPLNARHYKKDAWEPFCVAVNDGEVKCNLNRNRKLGSEATLCVYPTFHDTVTGPEKMKERANVTSEWLDRLTDLGCSHLFIDGKWLADLSQAAEMVEQGYDPFRRVQRRIDAGLEYCLENDIVKSKNIVLIGSSRYAFSALQAMAFNKHIGGTIAHQPVVWWPKMKEFDNIGHRNKIIKRNSLYEVADRYPPRPLLIQAGYMDQRVGPYAIQQYTEMLSNIYSERNQREKFTHEKMNVPGHSGGVPDSVLGSVSTWMKQQNLV